MAKKKGVTGSKDGLICDNTIGKKTAPLIDVETLKTAYLFGLDIKDPATDTELPNEIYQMYIDNAVSMLEHYLDISITRVNNFVEYRDYRLNDYADWGFYQLNNFPLIQINSMKLVYFRDDNGNPEAVSTIPLNWIRVQPHDGLVRLIPNAKFPANLQVSAAGNFFPEILRASMMPHAWEINYDYGFCEGGIPVLMNHAIGAIASLQALTVGGNLVVGAGIAGQSISLDGLSSSIQTTLSAENSAYSATIREYQNYLFGDKANSPFGVLTILRNYYKGASMNII